LLEPTPVAVTPGLLPERSRLHRAVRGVVDHEQIRRDRSARRVAVFEGIFAVVCSVSRNAPGPTKHRVVQHRSLRLVAGENDLVVDPFHVIVLNHQARMIGDRVIGVADANAPGVEELVVLVNSPAAQARGQPALRDLAKRVARDVVVLRLVGDRFKFALRPLRNSC
jgi:hypothetical protein